MSKTQKISFTALFTAAVAVLTMFPTIPIINGQGYINLGDSIIFLTAFSLGGIPALVAGAVGSCIADLLNGYAMYAPFTFVIKGLEGLICALLIKSIAQSGKTIPSFICCIISGCVMVVGYYLTDVILYGSFVTPIVSSGFNLIQAVATSTLGVILYKATEKYLKKPSQNKIS